jgi:hypothetical protein
MATGLGTAHAAAGVEAALGTMTEMHIQGCGGSTWNHWNHDGRFFCVECWHHFELNRFDRNLAVAVNGASTVAASATSTSSTSDLPHKRSHVDDGVSRSGEESHPRGKRRKNA